MANKAVKRRIRVVLVEPNNAGNIGAVARAMANFGVTDLTLVNPRCRVNDEARKRAKHAQQVLKSAKKAKTLKEALKGTSVAFGTTGVRCTDYNVLRSPVPVRDLGSKMPLNASVACVFGREDKGLSNEELGILDFAVTIPTSGKYPIMNLSHAVSIILYELCSSPFGSEISASHPQANDADKRRMLAFAYAAIDSAPFRTDSERQTQRLVWNRMLGKAMLTKREAYALMGFLKKLRKK